MPRLSSYPFLPLHSCTPLCLRSRLLARQLRQLPCAGACTLWSFLSCCTFSCNHHSRSQLAAAACCTSHSMSSICDLQLQAGTSRRAGQPGHLLFKSTTEHGSEAELQQKGREGMGVAQFGRACSGLRLHGTLVLPPLPGLPSQLARSRHQARDGPSGTGRAPGCHVHIAASWGCVCIHTSQVHGTSLGPCSAATQAGHFSARCGCLPAHTAAARGSAAKGTTRGGTFHGCVSCGDCRGSGAANGGRGGYHRRRGSHHCCLGSLQRGEAKGQENRGQVGSSVCASCDGNEQGHSRAFVVVDAQLARLTCRSRLLRGCPSTLLQAAC